MARLPYGHAPSEYRVARDALADEHVLSDEEIERVLEELEIDDVLREHELAPPAITVDGVHKHMKTLYEAADIGIDGEYLKSHGDRRGIGDMIYRKEQGQAQDLLRHRSIETTREAYQHIEAQERSEQISDLLDDD